jgi:peptide/nickel transport system substrate-binding protein
MMISSRSSSPTRRSVQVVAGLTAFTLLAGACGGEEKKQAKARPPENIVADESGLAEAGDPVRGGRIVYGIEAETSGGFCLPEARLATPGILIRNAIYDSLTTRNEDAEVKPYLAESVEPDGTFTTWTIGLRDGVTFHDGSELDATVVKNNFDAYLGRYPTRKPTLFPIILKNIDTVTVKDDKTVVVVTKTPWVAFPNYLTELGMMAQSQIDDEESCASKLVGTGPFKLASWTPDQELLTQRNPDYWQIAPDGEPYPYADAIAFRPITDAQSRLNALEAGEINVMASSAPTDIYGPLVDLRDDGRINLLISDDHAEVGYVMLNSSKPPFDDERMRRAYAQAIDMKTYNELLNAGYSTIAQQPFPSGDPGHVDDPGYPKFDKDAAEALVQEYVADGGVPEFTINVASEPLIQARAEVMQNMLGEVGITVNLHAVDQATLISEAIAGQFQAVIWRGHPGGEPDSQYLWWRGEGNPTNFGRIEDPEINRLLDAGRIETDPVKRKASYEALSRQFSTRVWNIWLTYIEWGIALSPEVHGVLSAELPDDGGMPFTGLANGHPVLGLWITSD